jgi:ERCC4-related helicase
MTVWKISPGVDLLAAAGNRVDAKDAHRQQQTAQELIRRLRTQPGQILADEVGLGKTYTALAVAASIALNNPDHGPVVVMVPPALRDKWPVEWSVFTQLYLRGRELRHAEPQNGLDFLRLLDDEERTDLVFLPHGAFRGQLKDPWVKLGLVRQILLRRSGYSRELRAVQKFGAAVIGQEWIERRHPGLVARLMDEPLAGWRKKLTASGLDPGDDPVPLALVEAIKEIDVTPLLEALRALPTNRSRYSSGKVTAVARALNRAIKNLWDVWLRRAKFRSPLLILDEAHHVKNRWTQLASLFANEEEEGEPGALFSRFERMLFLTATPFQLGHYELIEVLQRFGAVDWSTLPGSHVDYNRELKRLAKDLESAQAATLALDERWGRLRPDDVPATAEWWRSCPGDAPERLRAVRRAYEHAYAAMRRAEASVRPWVIRHRKPDRYPDGQDRRLYLRGAEIIAAGSTGGIDIASTGLLPFLLVGRAQVVFRRAQHHGRIPKQARALFADGLCSSFEAYRDTRRGSALDAEAAPETTFEDPSVRWYLDEINAVLATDHQGAQHPKIAATVARVVKLWDAGEKVVVFCHFRKTGSALRAHISRAIDGRLRESVADAFSVDRDEVPQVLESLGNRLYQRSSGTTRLARAAYREMTAIAAASTTATPDQRARLVEVLMRFLRSPVTLARFGAPLQSGQADAIDAVLNDTRFAGTSLRSRFVQFVEFFDSRIARERDELLDALERVQVGRYHADKSEVDGEDVDETDQTQLLPTVRLANGAVRQDARRRLLLAFNSPLIPEVLVASSVLAEGVDLHLECRFVIHHDLDWNPSTLEQRTGRVDRLGSLAARTNQPVTIFLPYLAATQDEKMYRVVRDRERWFQVVMGARHELDEQALETIAERVDLPELAAHALAFDLAFWHEGTLVPTK